MVESGTTAKSGDNMFVDSTKGNIKEVYHFKEKLANGGFGIVYLAENRQSKELFAVKAIQKKKVKDYTTFINEINILKLLVSQLPSHLSRRKPTHFSLGSSKHHKVSRNMGMERCLLPCSRVLFRR